MADVFPMARTRLLGWLIILTFALGVIAGPFLGIPEVMGGVFVAGYVFVLLVAVLGDSLSIVADSDGAGIWRRMGREFSKGRNLADDERVDVEPADPVAELRAAYVSAEIDEAEFERRLDARFDIERGERQADARDYSLDPE